MFPTPGGKMQIKKWSMRPVMDPGSLMERLSYPFADAAKVPNPDNAEDMIPARCADLSKPILDPPSVPPAFDNKPLPSRLAAAWSTRCNGSVPAAHPRASWC